MTEPTVESIIEATAEEFGLTPAQIRSYRIDEQHKTARWIAMHLAWTMTSQTRARIADVFERSDAAISAGSIKGERLSRDVIFKQQVFRLRERLNGMVTR